MDNYDTSKIRTQFGRSFFNGFPAIILHGNIVNIYIVYKITSDYKDINYPILENCLFGCAKLTKNAVSINMDILYTALDLRCVKM